MRTFRTLLSHHAAVRVADLAASALSIFRQLSMHTVVVRDANGEPLRGPSGEWLATSQPDVFVRVEAGLSPLRFDVWRDQCDDATGCLRMDAFGHHIEVYYLRRREATAR
jgi:hypothetical protein